MRESFDMTAEKISGENLHYMRQLHVAVDGEPVLEWLTRGCLVVSSVNIVCRNDVCPCRTTSGDEGRRAAANVSKSTSLPNAYNPANGVLT
jgi:hypothetical protein